MQEIICYTPYLSEGTERTISFMELLLDDNWANGKIICPEEVYASIGNINTRLTAKQNYEFLLRATQKYTLKAIGVSPAQFPSAVSSEAPTSSPVVWDDFCTDCYILGKYQRELLDSGYFNPVVETLLQYAAQFPTPKSATDFMEKMITHSPEYYEIDDDTRPILIYRGDDTCYNQLNIFADELAKALISCHQAVEIFDVQSEGHHALSRYINQRFKAIVGIQTYLFSIMMQDQITNLHDLIIGPKFQMVLDHPVLLKDHIVAGPKDYYLLIHDRNYLNFAKEYYKSVKDCFHFTPAGIGLPIGNTIPTCKSINISFIGTYYDYRKIIENIKSYDPKRRSLAVCFLNEMKHHPNQPAELGLQKVLHQAQIDLSKEDFLNLLFDFRYVFFCIMYYYREKTIRTLLDSKIEVDVYGTSWSNSPFAGHPCLRIHPQVTADESLYIMQQSRICLNIMAWHKDGFTERIANAMLNHSLVVSDKSILLEELFQNHQDLILFDLTDLSSLPELIRHLLEHPAQIETISENGYQKASENHQWKNRAEELLEILSHTTTNQL